MESSLSLHQHEAQEESDNLIQPHDHLIKIGEEEKEMAIFMEYDVYSAAEKGEINPIIEQRKDRLQSLLTPQRNTVLHIYLTSKTSKVPEPQIKRILRFSPKTSKDPKPETDKFVEAVLRFCPLLLMQVNTKEETPVHIAARYGHASIVKLLINHAKTDHTDHHNQDHEICGAEAAKKMLRMKSKEGDSALHETVRFRHLDMVEILIRENGDFDHNVNKSKVTPLYMAVEREYNDIAKEIIEHHNSPATGGPNDRNILHAATIRNDKEMIESILGKFGEQMLKHGDEKGWTPLHYAASMGNLDAVKTFLTKEMGRESAYMKNKDGDTALHLATVSDNMETMQEIIKRCPDSSELVNNKGWNILHSAVQYPYHNALMKDILQSRTSLSNLINEKDDDGNTPLHHIAISINSDQLNLIDDPRVDKLAFNNENKNALDLVETSKEFAFRENRFKKRLKKRGLRSDVRIYTKDSEQDKEDERLVDALRKAQDANAIVAALIATVTFTAGFTVPGGFVSEEMPLEGTPILGTNLAFKIFMVMDTIAMVLSTSSVLVHLFFYINQKTRNLSYFTTTSFFLTLAAMVAMVVAFATGTYAMLGYSISFSIAICVLALSFFVLFVYFLGQFFRRE